MCDNTEVSRYQNIGRELRFDNMGKFCAFFHFVSVVFLSNHLLSILPAKRKIHLPNLLSSVVLHKFIVVIRFRHNRKAPFLLRYGLQEIAQDTCCVLMWNIDIQVHNL